MTATDPTHVVPAVYETLSNRLRVYEEATGKWVEFVIDTTGFSSGIWRTGDGAPADVTGSNGDLWLDNLSGAVYQKVDDHYVLATNITGPQGLQGVAGTNGTNGATWRNGTGAPNDAIGADGDFYLDDSTGDVYKRAAGAYTAFGSILGPQGPQGPQGDPGPTGADGKTWRSATGAPSDLVGVDGDFYLDRGTGDVYQKSSGTYSIVANIAGPAGAPGADGADGTNGTNGADGADGSVWRDGSGAPLNTLGVDGDYYLDDDTGDVYLKTAGVYSIVANIKGADGASNFVGCGIRRSTNQSIPNSVLTAISFDTERYDVGAMFDPAQPTRITFPSGGVYHVGASLNFAAHADANIRDLRIRRNGVTDICFVRWDWSSANSRFLTASRDFKFAAGDYIEVYVIHQAGVALNVEVNDAFSPEFWAHKLS